MEEPQSYQQYLHTCPVETHPKVSENYNSNRSQRNHQTGPEQQDCGRRRCEFPPSSHILRQEEVTVHLMRSAIRRGSRLGYGCSCEHVAIHIGATHRIISVCNVDGASVTLSATGHLCDFSLSLFSCFGILLRLFDASFAIYLLGHEDGNFLSEENVFRVLSILENDGVSYLEIETDACVAGGLEHHHMSCRRTGNQR